MPCRDWRCSEPHAICPASVTPAQGTLSITRSCTGPIPQLLFEWPSCTQSHVTRSPPGVSLKLLTLEQPLFLTALRLYIAFFYEARLLSGKGVFPVRNRPPRRFLDSARPGLPLFYKHRIRLPQTARKRKKASPKPRLRFQKLLCTELPSHFLWTLERTKSGQI